MSETVRRQQIPLNRTLIDVLRRIPVAIVLLDEDRQVVFGQDKLAALTGIGRDADDERNAPGDVVGCVNAMASTGGCGTTEACGLCGANCAIVRSRESHETVTRECRIQYETPDGVGDLDLSVTAAPYESAGRSYTMVTVLDSSGEKRRRALERVFFHDILNLAGGLAGLASVLRSSPRGTETQEMLDVLESSARVLLDEIEAQRQLASAETGDLKVTPTELESLSLLGQVRSALQFHAVADQRTIMIADTTESFTFCSDAILARRIMVNLTKNALEASLPGETVTIGARHDRSRVELFVHNDAVMPDHVQQMLFQRSFSTKGDGRGLGAYSVRLLAERYLNGSVTFTSRESYGTTFRVSIPDGTT